MTQALLGSQTGTSVIRTADSVPILCTDFVECFLPPHVPWRSLKLSFESIPMDFATFPLFTSKD